MNKKILLTTAIAALVLLSSCLTSLHNLVTYKNVTSDDRITGTWNDGETSLYITNIPGSPFFKKINANENGQEKKSGYDSKEDSLLYSKSYEIGFIKDDYHYHMICCLTRIGNNLYADMQPLAAEPVKKPTAADINDLFSAGNYMTTHSIAKVIIRDREIEFRVLDGDFLKAQLNNGSLAVKYEKDDLFNTTLITASSDELARFLAKYGDDERLYSAKNAITLKKI